MSGTRLGITIWPLGAKELLKKRVVSGKRQLGGSAGWSGKSINVIRLCEGSL
ncbi:MAG: hypothetical protein V3V09_00435 [Arenicellales bacterium]